MNTAMVRGSPNYYISPSDLSSHRKPNCVITEHRRVVLSSAHMISLFIES